MWSAWISSGSVYYNQADSTTVHAEKKLMPIFNLKPTHKSVRGYCAVPEGFARLGVAHGSAVLSAIASFIGVMISESWIRAVRWIGFLRGGISILLGLNHKE